MLTQTLPPASTTGAPPPIHDGALVLTRGPVDGEDGRDPPVFGHGEDPAPVRGAVAVIATHPEHDAPGVERESGALQQRGRGGAGRVHVLVSSTLPVVGVEPDQHVGRVPARNSSATTKSSDRAGSITGVPVMPTVGVMSPQGRSPLGTGTARWVDQTTAPVAAERA